MNKNNTYNNALIKICSPTHVTFVHAPLLLHNDDLPSAESVILRLGHYDDQPPVFVQAGDCSAVNIGFFYRWSFNKFKQMHE